jgi:hypothetical protein
MTLLGKSTRVHQGRALERHYHCFFSYSVVLLFMRGYAEEEGWPDMAMYYPGHLGGSSPSINSKISKTKYGRTCPLLLIETGVRIRIKET